MKEYIKINKIAYDTLAKEFEEKINIRKTDSKRISKYFYEKIRKNFNKPRILELGPGSGDISKMLSKKGCETEAIEISEKMAEIIKKNSPNTKIMIGDFLEMKIDNKKYSGILAVAFIHLFKEEDANKIMKKINALLSKNGLAYITTTINEKLEEGYFIKTNFKQKVKRFRKKYTKKEIEKLILNNGFEIIDINIWEEKEVKGKKWMNYLIKKE